MNILLVEDNLTIIKGIEYALKQNNYNLIYKTNIKDTIDYLNTKNNINLIILDISLPDGNGLDFYIDNVKNLNIPTIFLTAKDDEEIVVKSINAGAEDYIKKPFSINELIARINRIMLRYKKNNIIVVKDIKFDIDKMIVYKNDIQIELTSLELKLLNLLFENIGKVVTRNYILDYILDITGNYIDDHTVTVYFNRIREKLDTDIIITVKGIGYRIDE